MTMKFPWVGVICLALVTWGAAGPAPAAQAKKCEGLSPTEGVTVEEGVITGTAGNDVILGTPGNDTIFGLDGDDVICGRGGDDNIAGGKGSDVIYGGSGDDDIYGDELPDGGAEFEKPASLIPSALSPSPQRDRIYGGEGSDNISGGEDDDLLDGGAGRDELSGDAGSDRLLGGNGKDYLYGDEGPDYLSGGEGNDMLHGGSDADELHGDLGSDELFGDEGDDRLDGGRDSHRDRLHHDDSDARSATADPHDLCYIKPDDGNPAETETRCEQASGHRHAREPVHEPAENRGHGDAEPRQIDA
jgi:Ca2+-binding RTX toxin-like protein